MFELVVWTLFFSQKHLTSEGGTHVAFHLCSLRSGFEGVIGIEEDTKTRLLNTCFRGVGERVAGNFAIFPSIQEFLNHPEIIQAILEEMEHLSTDPAAFRKDHSVAIDWDEPVGWSSTDLREGYHRDMLESRDFGHNKQASALFVRSRHLAAPFTYVISVSFRLVHDDNGYPKAIIRTIYPGEYVGRLMGDMTEREGVVFFDRGHPGAEIPKQVRGKQVTSV